MTAKVTKGTVAPAKSEVKTVAKPASLPKVPTTASDRHLNAADLAGMNKHEIRSVAHDRGYAIGEGGDLAAKFLAAQGAAKPAK